MWKSVVKVFVGLVSASVLVFLGCSSRTTAQAPTREEPGTEVVATQDTSAAPSSANVRDEPNPSPVTETPPSGQLELATDEAAPDEPMTEDVADDQDARYRALVIGTWEDDYQGHRTMTLHEDGTGTMVVELQGLQARLFASRLDFRMEWSLEAGRLKKRTVGGEPEGRVNMILKMMGDRVDEPILELTEDRLLLQDQDGETRYDWRRVTAGDKETEARSG